MVELEDADGLTGVGTAGFGNPATVELIHQLEPLVTGFLHHHSPRAVKDLFAQIGQPLTDEDAGLAAAAEHAALEGRPVAEDRVDHEQRIGHRVEDDPRRARGGDRLEAVPPEVATRVAEENQKGRELQTA